MTVFALASFLSLSTILALIRIFHKLWWAPIRLQRLMRSQGIGGPPYRFFHGSTKEIMSLQREATSKPLPGLSHEVFPKIKPHIHRWTSLYGKNYLQWIGSQAQLIVMEPELIKEVLNGKERLYTKTEPDMFSRKLFGDSIGVSRGEKWAKMRKLANHAFQAESLKGMFPAMVESVKAMIERWEVLGAAKEIDVFKEFVLLSSEVISRTAFGSSYLEGKAIFEKLDKLGVVVSRNFLKQRIPGISKIFKSSDQIESDKLEKGIHDSIKEIIKKREEKVMNGEEDSFGSDFLGLLLKAHHNTDAKQRISMDEMVDECKSFYLAGQETTSSLLAWTVFLLAVHTDWQEEARKEVLNLFGKQNPKPEGISRLKSTSMIINESLRLYPPAAAVSLRHVKKEVKLGDITVPANLVLYIPILAIHHDSRIWGKDAHLFKPERFAEGVAKATKDNIAAFIPFGMGPRICVGFNFATNEAKIALAMILQRYTFTLSPTYVHSPVQRITIRPQHGVQVILNPF